MGRQKFIHGSQRRAWWHRYIMPLYLAWMQLQMISANWFKHFFLLLLRLMGEFLVHSELGNNSAFSTNITSIRFLVYWLEHSRNTGCGKEIRKYSPKRTLNTKVQHLPKDYWRETSIQPQTICSGYWKEEGIKFSHSVMLKRSVMFLGQGPSLPKMLTSKEKVTRAVLSGWGNQCLKVRLVQDSSFNMLYTQ